MNTMIATKCPEFDVNVQLYIQETAMSTADSHNPTVFIASSLARDPGAPLSIFFS